MFDKTETIVLKIDGMSCAHCQKRVYDALKGVKGVKSVQVSLEDKAATVQYIPSKTGPEVLAQTVSEAGYTVVKG